MKTAAGLALLVTLTWATAARAATIELYTVLLSSTQSALYVTSSLGVGVGSIDFLASNATDFSFNPAPGVSLPDSVFQPQEFSDFPWTSIVINNVIGATIVGPGQTVLLGTFTSDAFQRVVLAPGETPYNGVPFFATTFYDTDLSSIVASDIESGLGPCDHDGCLPASSLLFTVPEPGVLALCLLAGALSAGRAGRSGAAARRSARPRSA